MYAFYPGTVNLDRQLKQVEVDFICTVPSPAIYANSVKRRTDDVDEGGGRRKLKKWIEYMEDICD